MEHETVMIACAHGTNNAEGQRRISQLRADIALLRPGLTVLEAYVDVQEPALPEVVAGLAPHVHAVVVPLLLTVGFHVQVDIADAVASRSNTWAAAPLGPDPRLAKLLDERIGTLPAGWGIVLAAAGSSRPEAAEPIEVLAADLAVRRPERILAAYGASARPTVPDAVAQLQAGGAAGWPWPPICWPQATSTTSCHWRALTGLPHRCCPPSFWRNWRWNTLTRRSCATLRRNGALQKWRTVVQ